MNGSSPASPHPASWWAQSAHPARSYPRLEADLTTEVAIIGAGFTGLATAHHLLAAGTGCVVLEAEDVGWGASGRNGGFAVPRYKKGFATLAKKYGNEQTRFLHGLVLEALDTLEATVEELGIDCGFTRCGHLTAAHGPRALAQLEADRAWLAAEAGDRTPRIMDARETAEEAGTRRYVGAYFDPRGGSIHPLDYARGLAESLSGRGVPIHARSPVTELREEPDKVVLQMPGGRVQARQVVLATNAYTAAHMTPRNLHRRIVPVATSVIATRPLSANVAGSILPRGRVLSDTKHLMHYFRMLPGRRLLFGGRGDITGRRDDPAIYDGLIKAMGEILPQAGDAGIENRWSGFVAVTLDDFPHLGRLSDRVAFALGYGGRGVALTNLMGKLLARMVRGEAVDAGPMSRNRFAPIPLHGLRVPMMRAAAAYYAYKDARDTAGPAGGESRP